MANPNVVPDDMTLYSAAEPRGRQFLKGEPWPGNAWSMKPEGDAVGSGTVAQAMRDVAAAEEKLGEMGKVIEGMNHDLAQKAGALEAAQAEIGRLTQAVADAEKAKAEAEAIATEATAAVGNGATAAQNAIARADAADAKVERLTNELAAANQRAADKEGHIQELETDLANAKAQIAKVDPDGDGKVGGSKKAA